MDIRRSFWHNHDMMAFLGGTARLGLIALLGIFLVTGYANAAVLCISPDGHVRIEPASMSCCGSDESSHADEPSFPIPAGGSDKCGDCLDVPVAGEYSAPKETQSRRAGSPEMSCTAVSHDLALAQHDRLSARGILAAEPLCLPHPKLASLRSVILLT